MDAELWAARLSAAKRHLQRSQNHWDQLTSDGFEVDEELKPDFACPYCFEDFDLESLCSHMEEEHPFESKGVACPVCAVKVPKDMVGHMTLHHGHLLKTQRRRRCRRGGVPLSSTISLLGKELREAHLQALLGGGALKNSGNSASNMVDSLLAAISSSYPVADSEDLSKQKYISEENLSKASTSSKHAKPSVEIMLSAEEHKQKMEQATLRARFVQQIVLSTVLEESCMYL